MKTAAGSAWPALVACAVLWTAFSVVNPGFLSAMNLANLSLQVAAMAVLAAGLVPVLLLGEIDLAAGAVGGLCAGVMAALQLRAGVGGVVSILAALACGACAGALHGLLRVGLGVPSFIVTLAGLMAWQGGLLLVLGETGSVNLVDPVVLSLTSTFLPGALGLLGAAAWTLRVAWRARTVAAAWWAAVPSLGLAWGAALVFAGDRGVPVAVLITGGAVALLDAALLHTRAGRHVYACGGNVNAARRAGIPVERVVVGVFAVCGGMAALSGVLGASRLLAVTQSAGSGDLLLNAVAAAVMGGTSLFGGRGRAAGAAWGALVIGSVSNGMDLLALGSAPKFMVTAVVLLAAVAVDAAARRRGAG